MACQIANSESLIFCMYVSDRNYLLQYEAAFESLSCKSEVANRKPAEQTHSSYVDHDKGRDISFIVSPYLLTRVAYECKFASLRYQGCNVNRISSRLWHGGMRQLRRSLPREKCKRRTPKVQGCRFRFMSRQIDNVETRTRIFGLDMRFGSCNDRKRKRNFSYDTFEY